MLNIISNLKSDLYQVYSFNIKFCSLSVFIEYIFALFGFRQQYFKLIDECVSQIVLHRDGMDPDFAYRKRLDLDLSQFVGEYFFVV